MCNTYVTLERNTIEPVVTYDPHSPPRDSFRAGLAGSQCCDTAAFPAGDFPHSKTGVGTVHDKTYTTLS